MIITVGNTKGGTGKSTIATTLAALYAGKKKKTLLIDADVQGSSMFFSEARAEDLPAFSTMANTTNKIHKAIASFDHDVIIIDAGGRDSQPFRSALIASDLLIIPVTPSPIDLWSTEDVFKMLEELRTAKDIKAGILLNMVQPGVSITNDVLEILGEYADKYSLFLFMSMIYFRIGFKEAFAEGCSVTEMKGEKFVKAAAEINEFYKEVSHAVR